MDVRVLQETLSKNLSIAARFTNLKSQLPVLGNLLLSAQKNKLLIAATNLECSISINIGAKVEKEGDITVPAKTLTDLMNNLESGQVSLKTEKEKLIISSQDFNSEIVGMNASDFPSIPHSIKGNFISLPSDIFNSSLNQVLFSVSSDETRPILTGVLMIFRNGELILVSTDGFRLSQKKIKIKGFDIDKERKIVLPKNTLSEVLRLSDSEENIKLFFDEKENQAIFEILDIVLSSRIIEGEFPDFERILPKNSKIRLELDRDDFLRSVRLAGVLARDSANVIKLKINKNSMLVLAESSRSGKQETVIDVKIESEENLEKDGFLIAYNYRFLEEFLNVVKGENVRLEFSDANSPGLFLDTKDPSFLHIIMPIRLSG